MLLMTVKESGTFWLK